MSDMFEIGVSLALSDGVADEMARLRLDMARWQAGLRTGGVPVGALNQAAARALSVSGAAVPERVVVPKAVSVPVPPPPPPLAAQGPGPAAPLLPQAATLRPVDGGEAGPAAERASERLVAVVQAWPPHPVAPGAGREAPPIPQAPLESRAVASPHAATLGMLGENARQPAAVPMAPFMPAARIGASLGVPQDMPRWTQPDAQVPPTGQAPEMVRAPATPVWTMSASLDAAPGAPSQPVAPVASTIIQQAVAGQPPFSSKVAWDAPRSFGRTRRRVVPCPSRRPRRKAGRPRWAGMCFWMALWLASGCRAFSDGKRCVRLPAPPGLIRAAAG